MDVDTKLKRTNQTSEIRCYFLLKHEWLNYNARDYQLLLALTTDLRR